MLSFYILVAFPRESGQLELSALVMAFDEYKVSPLPFFNYGNATAISIYPLSAERWQINLPSPIV